MARTSVSLLKFFMRRDGNKIVLTMCATGLFDSHSLFADMFARPHLYLNGTAPLNVTGAVHSCVLQPDKSTSDPVCTDAVGTDQDSFLWYVALRAGVTVEDAQC